MLGACVARDRKESLNGWDLTAECLTAERVCESIVFCKAEGLGGIVWWRKRAES